MTFEFYLDAWRYVHQSKLQGASIVKRSFKEWEVVV